MIIGNKKFDKDHTYIMGILNVTPDSFSDGGEHNDYDQALFHAEKMINEGADIIDVGGESTRPGHIQISIEEEIDRTAKVIEGIKSRLDIPVSIDSYKSQVVKAALDSGADLVNDIWGLKYDEKMAGLIADYAKPCCLMHNRKAPVEIDEVKLGMNNISGKEYLARELEKDMLETLQLAKNAGIKDENIILDPGIGFGKTYEHNMQVLSADNFMLPKGYPVLLATSRKSVIGLTLDLPVHERVEGTLATTMLAVAQKAMMVRVHDIKENARVIKMLEEIYKR